MPTNRLLDLVPHYPLDEARRAVAKLARPTPLLPLAGGPARAWDPDRPPVLVKLESLQMTGSFKLRGAAASLATLGPEARGRGVVACSSGNHGRAVAHVAHRMGVPATILVPAWVDPVKLDAVRGAGARVVLVDAGYDEAESRAIQLADDEELAYISPFDDPWVIAGQASLTLEIVDAVRGPFTLVTPLSGGGLAGGAALALASRRPGCRLVAVSAARARGMLASLEAGRPVEVAEEETLAGALSGGIGDPNHHTLSLVREGVDHHLEVEEDRIAEAMAFAWHELGVVVEGGGAVGLAALRAGELGALADRSDLPRPLVIVVSGGNVDAELLGRVLSSAGPPE